MTTETNTTEQQEARPVEKLSATLAPSVVDEAARREVERAEKVARAKGDSKSLMAYLRLKRRAAD